MMNRYYGKVRGRWGNLVAGIFEDGHLFGLWFEGQKYFPDIPEHALWLEADHRPNEVPGPVAGVFESLKTQLAEYEEGKRTSFDLPLKPQGTPFRRAVWDILLDIDLGETTTYGEIGRILAERLGKARMSAQAVGGAVGHNPISIVIPCHRVVGADGKLTGYAGGIDKKEKLLRHEASVIRAL